LALVKVNAAGHDLSLLSKEYVSRTVIVWIFYCCKCSFSLFLTISFFQLFKKNVFM